MRRQCLSNEITRINVSEAQAAIPPRIYKRDLDITQEDNLGMEVEQSKDSIKLHLDKYIQEALLGCICRAEQGFN